MGIRTLVSNLKTHINMKLQITVLFALVAAAAAAKLPMDQYKQQAMAARDNAQSKMADADANAQNMLSQNNIDFDVQSQVDSAMNAFKQNIEAQDFQGQANAAVNNAKKQMNQALKGIENKKLRNNLKNLFTSLQAEASKRWLT